MTVLIEYTGKKQNITFMMKYLKRPHITCRGQGSVFRLDDDDNHQRLVDENPNIFRYAADKVECEYCKEMFAPGNAMMAHKQKMHPEAKLPDGSMTRQNKTPGYKKRLSEVKMPNHGSRK